MPSTIITGITDTHCSNNRPASRTDEDWVQTQINKLEDFLKSSVNIDIKNIKGTASAMIHGGDFFNQPKGESIKRSLDQWLMVTLRKKHCDFFAIPGNHDMFGHRVESLKDHPYGCLESSGIITSVIWPNYALVGTNPIVLITGKEYCPDGPATWLEELRDTDVLTQWKKDISEENGKVPVYVLALSHNYWGPEAGWKFGESVTSYNELCDTGIDVMFVGHDHDCKGIQQLENDGGSYQWVIEPGSLIRGTIAEKDVRREPKMVIMEFDSKGNHHFLLRTIIHDPSENVFDFTSHAKEKKQEETRIMVIEECRKLEMKGTSIEVILNSMETQNSVSPRVASLTREYLTRAEATEK